jgi:histone-binding protein RBBP4
VQTFMYTCCQGTQSSTPRGNQSSYPSFTLSFTNFSISAVMAAETANSDVADVLEERLIDAEYKIWKKNTPYLYDFVMTHSLEWPSLSCQWLPVVKNAGESASEHSLLLGTHTTGEQNYLMLASVNLPKSDAVIDHRSETNKENATNAKASSTATPAAHYDEEKKELGGFGHANSGVGKIEIRMKVKHEGEVNRARYMPQNHFVVASRGPSPEIYIWDLSKHPSFPSDDSSPFCPQGVCIGHAKEGYGLAWSTHTEGHLISGSEDKTLALWDINSAICSKSETGTQIKPLSIFSGHTAVVEDVDWHERDPNMVGSVSDDRSLMIWDVREKNAKEAAHVVQNAHGGDVNCIAFNPINEFVLATGSADKTVAIWDMRNLKS